MPIGTVLVSLAVGLGLSLVGLKQRRKLRASLSWQQVAGTVVSASVEQGETGNSEDGYSTSFTPTVRYSYQAGATTHTGSRISHSVESYTSRQKAQSVLDAYPAGGPVAVYVDPARPGDSVLVRAAKGSVFLLWVGVTILLLTVAAVIKGAWK